MRCAKHVSFNDVNFFLYELTYLSAPFNVLDICDKLEPISEIRKASAVQMIPQMTTINFVANVLWESFIELKYEKRFKKSDQIIADKLLRADETELSDAQNILPKKSPADPGITLNLSITKKGTIWLGLETPVKVE